MLSLQEWGICEENIHLQSNEADRYWVFAPTAQKGYFTEIMEHVGYSGLEKSGGGKELCIGQKLTFHPPQAPLLWSSWLYHPCLPGTSHLEINFFFTSTCLANGMVEGRDLVLWLFVSQSYSSKCQDVKPVLGKHLLRSEEVLGRKSTN